MSPITSSSRSFSLSTSTTAGPFELLHCDFWTSRVTSNSGFSYYLVILDYYTHYCWTFPLMHKFDMHQCIVVFVAYDQFVKLSHTLN